jgi:adenylate cyclase class 2
MNQEIEVKFYPVKRKIITKSLSAAGAVCTKKRTLMRRAIFGGEDNPNINATYIRVRDEGDEITLSAKINAKADGAITDQKELQIVVPDFQAMVTFLKVAGLRQSNYQETYRTVWLLDDCEVMLDEWPMLEPYIEIEGPSIASLQIVAQKLDMNWDDQKIVSTDELVAMKLNITKKEALALMKNVVFDEAQPTE